MEHSRAGAGLRLWLGKKLGSPVEDWLWNHLEREGYTEAGPADLGEVKLDLLGAAKRLIQTMDEAGQRRHPAGRQKSFAVTAGLSEGEKARATAFSTYIASVVSGKKDVRGFRETYLEGGTITAEKANLMLGSPACQVLSGFDFYENNVPVVGHTASYKMNEPAPVPDKPGWWCDSGIVYIKWTDGKIELPWDSPYFSQGGRNREMKYLKVISPGQKEVSIPVWPSSVLSQLHEVSKSLAEDYPWLSGQATWFVLTGRTPFIAPVRVTVEHTPRPDHRFAKVTLEIEPWISRETVDRVYRDLQKRILARDKRELSPKNLELTHYVWSRRKPDGSRPTWRRMLDDWNRIHPEFYYEDVRRFSRDYRRAGGQVASPPYSFIRYLGLYSYSDVIHVAPEMRRKIRSTDQGS